MQIRKFLLNYRIASRYEDVSPYFDREYNAPKISEKFSQEAFRNERDCAYQEIEIALGILGELDVYGHKDFSTGRDWFINSLSRTIGIVASSPRMMIPALIPLIHETLQKIEQDYVVTINGLIESREDFYVAVLKGGDVIGYAENARCLQCLGFK